MLTQILLLRLMIEEELKENNNECYAHTSMTDGGELWA